MAKKIDSLELPQGLRGLSPEELTVIAHELRDELIDTIASSGGHFASSLGATEITVALHAHFDTPHDRIVWDVGHQAYVHKMLTGRREKMSSIRKDGGLSGFLKRDESPYDAFGAGHAGTSISAAVGMRVALPPERYVVAVIGDGSLTAGMAFEALNHIGALGLKRFIVVVNDNEMSISRNVGALSWLFSRAVTSKTSTRARSNFKDLYKRGYVPEIMYRAIDRAEEAAQAFFATPAMLFGAFGVRYIGPVDGHDLTALSQAIENAKQQDGPVVIHAATVKGKGYEPAEEDPVTWHGVTPFDRARGELLSTSAAAAKKGPSYTAVFSSALIECARKHPDVIAITAAMPGGTGLDRFQEQIPERFYDVGICEQHAVTFAAGLACEGKRPVCAIYSTFLQRAFDQVVHDVCVQNLPVVFCMDRGGVVGNDGETHQGVFDIAFLRALPHMTVMSPRDENELRHMLWTALHHQGPIALRYPRGNSVGVPLDGELKLIEIGKAELLRQGTDVLCVAFGPLASSAHHLAQVLEREHNISMAVINARFAKPLDREMLMHELPKYPVVITLEDHALAGGFGSALLELINDEKIAMQSPLQRFGVADEFVPHGSQEEQIRRNGYDLESIRQFLCSQLKRRLAVA